MPLEFRPKLDKIVELLLYLAHVRPNADKYQAVKFLYLADKEHLIRHGRPITGETYFALPYGPVASKAMDLLEGDYRTLRDTGIETLPFSTEAIMVGKKAITYIREPLREVDFSLFSKSDIRVFDEIIKEYGHRTFEQLFELTHDHFAYKRAWNSRKHGSKRSPMRYEDMIEPETRRAEIIEDIAPIAMHME
jgi:uncharacterized phage-associated protein